MREYKFRGKRINSDEWIYGYGVVIGEHYGRMHGEEREASIFVEYDEASKLNFQLVEVDPKTVGQYTGLQDRNGKDIYEGDVVVGESFITSMQHLWGDKDIKNKSETHIIKYHEASFKLFDYKGNWVAVLNHHVMSKAEKLEVIGNRFDNPELLGEVRE